MNKRKLCFTLFFVFLACGLLVWIFTGNIAFGAPLAVLSLCFLASGFNVKSKG